MNFLKRAWYSLLYRKKNTLLMLLMFFVLGTLVLAGLCIRNASRQSVQQIQQDVGAEIVISNAVSETGTYGINGLTLSTVEIASGLTGVTSVEYSSRLEALPGDFEVIWSAEQKERYGGLGSITVAGEGNTVAAADFAEGTSVISSGRHIVKTDKAAALIHATLAEHNGLDIGDSITIRSPLVDEEVEVRIVGIFTTEDTADFDTKAPYQQPENKVYISIKDSFTLLGGEMVYQGVLTLEDPTKADEYVERIHKFFKPIEEEATCFIRDTEYRSLAGPLSSVQGAAAVMVIAVLVMGAVILVLVTLLSMRAREFEMGILLSMGERKWKIIFQLFLELLVPILIAVTLSILPVRALLPSLGSAVGLREAAYMQTDQVTSLYGAAVLLAAVSTVVSAGKVLRCQPKKIMTAVK